ncbi:MAG: hypothetical protein KAU83_09050 [Bacteroidales bacterium]|nr:hypothetical protein [Bacteroidales bacterium]
MQLLQKYPIFPTFTHGYRYRAKDLKNSIDPEIQKRCILIDADEIREINKRLYKMLGELKNKKGAKNDRNK